ncbi:MAG: hypothetical protein QM723_34200 [Myxococcaceae bacterium]
MRVVSLVAVVLGAAAWGADPGWSSHLIVSGSAAVDYRYISGDNPPSNPSSLGINGLGLEAAVKAVVDVGHGVSFSAKVCGGCHGIEVDQAYGEALIHPRFNLRAGRINVPFGEFNVRHDPVNFTTPSKPLPYAMGDLLYYGPSQFNLGVVPAPFIDNGAEVFGRFGLGKVSLDYSLYVVEGLAGTNEIDFVQSRRYLDNNRTPAGGARLILSGDDWSLGASFTGGTYDAADKRAYLMAGLDLYARLGRVVFRAEALGRRTDIDPTLAGYPFQVIDPFVVKAGYYAQLDLTLHPNWILVARTDGLFRFGPPLPGSPLSPTAFVLRQTLALMARINENFAVKADYELWTFDGTPYPTTHVGRASLVVGI